MNYRLERQKRNTVAIKIENGSVIVKAPIKAELAAIERFISQKSDWISKKITEYNKKTAEFARVISGEYILYRGEHFPLTVSDKYKRVVMENGVVCVPTKYDGKPNYVVNAYKRVAEKELEKRLGEISAMTGLKYKSFKLTNAKTKWGSCDGQCNVMLNWRLLMTEPWIIDYVIVHELAHTVHHDHSKKFWALVGKYYQNYKAAQKRLKEYSILTSLYR